MKVSLNWLKDFVDINVSLEELCDKLVGCGFEVEEIIEQGGNMKNVVLGQIKTITKHPDADKLQICMIDVGQSDLVQIITGAQNVSEGDLVPVALHNSLLPTGQVIKKGKLRGIDSYGMLCSGEELMLTESEYKGAGVYGIMLMNKETAPVGTDLKKVLGYDDVILDIGVTANRADCNSVLGIAREVATVLKTDLKMPDLSYDVDEFNSEDYVDVDVNDKTLCPRYMGTVVKDIKIVPSCDKIQKRLLSVGLRPINNIVDITNYILIEIGQPMHAFDLALLKDNKIVVRDAKDGETIKALDNNEYKLDNTMLAICDAEKPCAVAGVMGGADSAINENTKDIVFEAAKFLRDNIRRTARTLNLHTDSSFRFERGIDFESQEIGMKRALHIISKYGYGKIAKTSIDKTEADFSERIITTTTDKINSILGITVPSQEMVDILNSLQIKTTLKGNQLKCIQPGFRDDIENANDLAEEIIRLYGYDHIGCRLMDGCSQTVGGKTQDQINEDTIKEIAVSNGLSEILTYSFVSPKNWDFLTCPETCPFRNAIKLLNPLGEDMSIMRTSLSYSMLNALAKNYLKNIKAAKLFEIAHIYVPNEDKENVQPKEINILAMGMYGDGVNYYTIKGIVDIIIKKFGIKAEYERVKICYMHSGRTAKITFKDQTIGYVGEVHPNISDKFDVKEKMYLCEMDIDKINELADYSYKFVEIGKYPPIERDIAVVVNEDVMAAQLIKTIKSAGGNMLTDCNIFDIYRSVEALGEYKKSVAINLIFRLADRTLTEDEVNNKINRILNKLSTELGAELRV